MKKHAKTEFGIHLKRLRMDAHLSVRGLAERAGISFALLTGIENARRGAGRSTVERLGCALGFTGEALRAFILAGLVIGKRDVLLEECCGYPSAVVNALPLVLRRIGLGPESVQECTLGGQTTGLDHRGQVGQAAELVLRLKDGRRVQVSFLVSTG